MTAYNVYDPRNYEGIGDINQQRQLMEIQAARFGYRPYTSGGTWERYGESPNGVPQGFSPEQAQYIQQQAAAVQPYVAPEPAPPGPPAYGQEWVDSLTSGYSNPLLDRRPQAVERPAFAGAGAFGNPVGSGQRGPSRGGQTISLQPGSGAFSPMLRPQSAPHGNGGGNVNNPNNQRLQSTDISRSNGVGQPTDPYQKMFAAMLQR